jgi:hypothetical protein
MTEHYTKLTVSAMHFCSKREKSTEHRVDGGRLGPCLNCIEKLQIEHAYNEQMKRQEQRQGVLFGEAF